MSRRHIIIKILFVFALSIKETKQMSLAVRKAKIAFLSGSLRNGSYNTKLVAAAEKIASQMGADTDIVDLDKFDLPLYNQDLEANDGMPSKAVVLKERLGEKDAWIVASPEYNGFPTPLLVNTFTWLSRGDPDGEMYTTFSGKSAIVLAASPGAMGGLRAINPLRTLLTNLGVNVLAPSVAVGAAYKAFDDDDNLVDERQQKRLHGAVEALVHTARDTANRDVACKLINQHLTAGEYGSIDIPGAQ